MYSHSAKPKLNHKINTTWPIYCKDTYKRLHSSYINVIQKLYIQYSV